MRFLSVIEGGFVRTPPPWAIVLGLAALARSGSGAELTDSASYLSVRASPVALRHVEIIDGSGAAPRTA